MNTTYCKDAIKKFEEKTGESCYSAVEVKLICQIPPIEKMDEGLYVLEKCQKLSLSTNAITKMCDLSKLKKLKVLSLGRNNIKQITGLDQSSNLEELWISHNQIEKLDGLYSCTKLHTLFINNNKIASWTELDKLQSNSDLKTILLFGNPLYQDPDVVRNKNDAKFEVIRRLPQIESIDGALVSAKDRQSAVDRDEAEFS